MGFSIFQLDPKVSQGVREMGYSEPTPIQRLLKGPRGRVRALVIAPTRELAEQIHEAFRGLGRHTGLRSMTVYGGVGMGQQLAGFRAGVEVVVACPGRLLDHLGQNAVNLSGVEVLVLDEADRMFDMGFLPDIRRIIKRLPPGRQNLLFSATMPADIRHLAHEVLRDPVTVQVDHDKALKTVTHALYPLPEGGKEALLLEMLRRMDAGTVLVFTRTKRRAKKLDQRLKGAGFAAASLQGNLSQNRRKEALDGFRDGSYRILVATDIAARGIDVSQISHVVNFDMPDTVEAYTHRIGRTGRAARTGDAFTFVTPADEDMVRRIEKAMNMRLERRTLEGFDYSQRPAPGPRQQHGPRHHGPKPQHHAPRPAQGPAPEAPRRSLMSSRSHRPHRRRR